MLGRYEMKGNAAVYFVDRHIAQGDTRPVIGQGQAMQKLRGLLASREKLYAMSDYKLDTSHKPLEKTAAQLIKLIQAEQLLG